MNLVKVNQTLRCDMIRNCQDKVTHVDHKGYIYCETHGKQRQASVSARALTTNEVDALQAGQTITY